MQKIMFNDKYGLTAAVLQGRKTMTRRAVPDKWQTPLTEIFEDCNYDYSQFWKISDVQFITNEKAPYKVGEVVAIAQSYKDVLDSIKNPCELFSDRLFNSLLKEHKGWYNKMFVKAEFMPHRLRITDIKVERLQDISDEDCLKEGIYEVTFIDYSWEDNGVVFGTQSEAFAALIDKVSGRGTWKRNPWVFAYSYELVK